MEMDSVGKLCRVDGREKYAVWEWAEQRGADRREKCIITEEIDE